MKEYLKLMRVNHYLKNFLIFVPAFFAGVFFEITVLVKLILGFIALSFIASTVYIINDIKDVEKDRKHEIKKNRPIASGTISRISAILVAGILTVVSQIIVIFLKGSVFSSENLVLIAYLAINIAYRNGLKNKPILDVMILALGFVLRVILGSLISGCMISQWLCLTIMMFSLYMGLGKRRNEIRKVKNENTRNVLKYYTEDFLNGSMLMTKTLGLVFYALWSAFIVSNSAYMIWTVPLVMAILMKYELNIANDNFGDPVDVLLSDKSLIILVTAYLIIILIYIYCVN